MKTTVLLAVLALAGCDTQSSDYRAVNEMCHSAQTIAAWNDCVERGGAQVRARQARAQAREEAMDDAMAAGIIVGNFNRPRRMECMLIGNIVTC